MLGNHHKYVSTLCGFLSEIFFLSNTCSKGLLKLIVWSCNFPVIPVNEVELYAGSTTLASLQRVGSNDNSWEDLFIHILLWQCLNSCYRLFLGQRQWQYVMLHRLVDWYFYGYQSLCMYLECKLSIDLVMALCEGNLAKENGLLIFKVNVLLLSRTHSIVSKPTSLLSRYKKKQLSGSSRSTHVIAYASANGQVPFLLPRVAQKLLLVLSNWYISRNCSFPICV
jgi:hypothetical protein